MKFILPFIAFFLSAGGVGMAQIGEVVAVDEAAFAHVVAKDASLRKLGDGYQFIEGPVWSSRDGGFLLFSDIPASTIYRWQEGLDQPEPWRTPSDRANGNTRDTAGRLITCHHDTRTVTRTSDDGTIETIADTFNGKRLNSPNDAVVKSDGSIWFTDPPYGLKGGTEGKELDINATFCLNPATNEMRAVDTSLSRPNGLCFSPDEKKLYIAESDPKFHQVFVYDVAADNTLANKRLFCTLESGVPDGMRCDSDGRLYSSAADGVHVFDADGKLIGRILTPLVRDPRDPSKQRRQTVTNLCFGGPGNRTLFLTATKTLYSIEMLTSGAVKH